METFIFVIFFGLMIGIAVLLGLHRTQSIKDRKQYQRGIELCERKAYHKALIYFNQIVKKRKSAVAWAFKGICHLNMKDYYQALHATEEALKIDYELKEAYFCKGRVYYYLEDFELAKSNFELAHWYTPKTELLPILKYQVLCAKKIGNFEKAREFLKQARDLGDENANYELLKIKK